MGGSSDVGDVSWLAPTMQVSLPMMPNDSAHTWVMTACAGSMIGRKSALAAAHVVARLACDLLTDAELRAAARAGFVRRTAGFTYVSPLPADQTQPYGLPNWLNNDGSVETIAGLECSAAR
jgi:aminobenzoyl-glutamate utilization protein B